MQIKGNITSTTLVPTSVQFVSSTTALEALHLVDIIVPYNFMLAIANNFCSTVFLERHVLNLNITSF